MQLFTRLLSTGVLTTALTVTALTLSHPAKASAAHPKYFAVNLTLYLANGTTSQDKYFGGTYALPEDTPGSVLRACREAGDFHLATDLNVVDYSCSLELIN